MSTTITTNDPAATTAELDNTLNEISSMMTNMSMRVSAHNDRYRHRAPVHNNNVPSNSDSSEHESDEDDEGIDTLGVTELSRRARDSMAICRPGARLPRAAGYISVGQYRNTSILHDKYSNTSPGEYEED